jgi:NAD(P)-dependent dehydrogenase (short-subunit alcohol dehydrogenase family)
MIKSVLITGANAGLGKESARQFALQNGIEKIYLGCRNEQKAKAAKRDLEQSTGKSVFEIVLLDVTDLTSVKSVVKSLGEPIEALIMNAGGSGGSIFNEKTKDGVTQIFAMNLLGHVVLAEELIKAEKLTKAALYAGSEAVRGVPSMGIKHTKLKTSSTDEFASIADGIFFGNNTDPMIPYGPIKYMAALWMSTMARKYPDIRFITMSPGATAGTEVMSKLPAAKRIMFQAMFKVMLLIGKVHKLEVGAKRFVDGLQDESYKSGIFYASKSGVTGPIVDQATIFDDLNNHSFQDNANEAIHRFIK